MLKPRLCNPFWHPPIQPPSGGCVLKHLKFCSNYNCVLPAAFRRLCVETCRVAKTRPLERPAAFRRLCVETPLLRSCEMTVPQPPSGGCVLKQSDLEYPQYSTVQPPSGGCVLKRVQRQRP